MSKIRTLEQVQDVLDREMSWRLVEIAAFKFATKSKNDSPEQRAYLRAGVAMVYAHWEGFIKISAETYLEYVGYQRHAYNELKACFAVFGLKGRLNELSESRRASRNVATVEFIVGEMGKPAKMLMSSAVETSSNLSSTVFIDIATSVGIAIAPYELRFKFVDESLVGRRNKIAHGERLDLSAGEFAELADAVLDLMRLFKTDVENSATLKSYLRPVETGAFTISAG